MLSTFLTHLQRVPLLARLRSDLSVQELLEIGDALLAAPILIVEIAVDFADSYATLAEFRRRYGEHMVVGAAEIRTFTQLQAAMAADAQFFAMPTLDANLLRLARHQQLLCLPHVTTPAEAQFAQLEGCPLVSVAQAQLYCFPLTAWPQAVTIVASDTTDIESIPTSRVAGVAGLRVQQALFPTVTWSHAGIVTLPRVKTQGLLADQLQATDVSDIWRVSPHLRMSRILCGIRCLTTVGAGIFPGAPNLYAESMFT